MPKSHFARMRLLGSAAVIGLFGSLAGTAQAAETTFGEVSITLDTTVSMGASMRVADRDFHYLPEGNGGPVDPRTSGLVVINTGPIPTLSGLLGSNTYTLNPDNFDGSVNTDDGRLNFDNGDLIGANVKANHDLLVKWQNYTLFARAVGFYDVVLNDADVGERSRLTDQARGDVGRNYELLDLFISADYTLGDLPANLRIGKQVINWGESTFILNGNNVFNPIDVGAFRRPGAEIKEALVPVNAISGSITLPEDWAGISFAGYYALDWEPFEIDPSGTPFSGADVIALGSGVGGNERRVSFLASSPVTGARRNCTAAAGTGTQAMQTGATPLLNDPNLSQANRLDCTDDNGFTGIYANTIDYTSFYTIGFAELTRLGLARQLGAGVANVTEEQFGVVDFGGEVYPDDDGQFGLSARYLADWFLGGTEFGFYYQNYHSRLPFVSERVGGRGELSIGVTGTSAQATSGGIGGRTLLPSGCGYGSVVPATSVVAGAVANGAITSVNTAFGDAGAPTPDGIGLDDTLVDDPQDLINATTAANLAVLSGGTLTLTASASGSLDTVLNAMKVNCMLAFFQSTNLVFGAATPTLVNGAETLGLNSDIDLLVEYPENIEVFGMSFASTLWGWGIQGDFTYRPEAPFQIDADSLTIAAAWKNCAFQVATVAAFATLNASRTPDGSELQPQCIAAGGVGAAAGQSSYVQGFKYNEMFTAQVGTTATFTQSEWWLDAMGADLGILVTEFGMVYVPGVEDEYLGVPGFTNVANRKYPVYANVGCNGSELPLGGLLGLDGKTSHQCRPDDFSAGLVLLFALQYNNAFDTGFLVSPTIAYQYDYTGTTPSPYGNYIEDRQALNLGVTGTLNNNFRVGASYTNFFGGHIVNKARDQDFVSATASYSF